MGLSSRLAEQICIMRFKNRYLVMTLSWRDGKKDETLSEERG